MGLPSFVEKTPDYHVKHGRMHVAMGDSEMVMPVHVFLAGCAKGNRVVAAWQRKEADAKRSVVPIKGGH